MKKMVALLLLISVGTALLAACSDSSSDSGSPIPGISQSEYEEARQAVIDADREWRDENLF